MSMTTKRLTPEPTVKRPVRDLVNRVLGGGAQGQAGANDAGGANDRANDESGANDEGGTG